MEQIRIIKEMRHEDKRIGRTGQAIRPRYMVWENVPGSFSSNKGQDFSSVLQETVRVVYEKAPSVPVPKNGWPTAGCLTDMDGKWSVAWRVFDAQFWGVPQRRRRIALVADFGGLTAPEILFEREGVSGNFEKSRKAREGSPRGAETGSDFAKQENSIFDARWNGDGSTCNTITGDHNNRVTDYTTLVLNINGEGIAGTLDASYYKGAGNRSGKEREFIAVAGFKHGAGKRSRGIGYEPNKAPTLRAVHDASVLVQEQHQTTPYRVRRLTPLECERLQGFPDGWTDIGEWFDSKGKKRKSSDSARYKALGNSIALPPWFYVLRKVSDYCGDDKTMASLFDGIGGFPLIWETLNGRGTCLWASEIDEFPIAVTKIHIKE